MTAGSRREDLAERATDYALTHGLIGLSLRPLASALGTSDRMLLYHFAGKDDLVATILRVSNDRAIAAMRGLPVGDDVAESVGTLWHGARGGQLARCQRLYVEAAALGLFGLEPYASTVARANEQWTVALVERLQAAGCQPDRARRVAALIDSVLIGLLLDQPLKPDEEQGQVIADLQQAVSSLAGGPQSGKE